MGPIVSSRADWGNRTDTLLTFSLDLRITTDDLKSMTPQQIRAVFDAVGVIAALGDRSRLEAKP